MATFTRLGRSIAKASALVMCFVGVALEGGSEWRVELFHSDTYSKSSLLWLVSPNAMHFFSFPKARAPMLFRASDSMSMFLDHGGGR